MRPRPQALVFDLGKVLLEFDYAVAARAIAARGNRTAAEINSLINQSPLLHRLEVGALSPADFIAETRAATGFRGNDDEFAAVFGDIFQPITPMIDLHHKLRKQKFPAYIFSNTNHLAIAHIREHFPFFADFDGYVFSHEHGAMKPDARLYEIMENVSGRRGAEILYVDDRPENVDAGAKRGWQVLLHETVAQTEAGFRAAGLLD